MNDPKRRSGEPVPIPPLADPAEAVERIVPRRQLLLEDGDVLIVRASAGLHATIGRAVYELRLRGQGATGERFASFEHAASRGDQLALQRHVRLMFIENQDEPPHLLKDYRQ